MKQKKKEKKRITLTKEMPYGVSKAYMESGRLFSDFAQSSKFGWKIQEIGTSTSTKTINWSVSCKKFLRLRLMKPVLYNFISIENFSSWLTYTM